MIFHSSRESDFLTDLDASLRQMLFDAAIRRQVAAGQAIQREGDTARTLMIIRSGRVRLSRTSAEGKRMALAHLGDGDLFGLFALIIGRPKNYDADAEIDTSLLVVDRPTFNGLLDCEAAFRNHVFTFLGRRLESAFQALNDERNLPLTLKTARMLLYYADEEGEVRLTQEALAEQLGASRNGLGLALKSLAGDGLIERHYGSIRIIDREGLDRRLSDQGTQDVIF
ncbi:Crp/Fnr family transcriptional regulator [Parvibaculum sp. MBR-TMA-1.3b-4.2]|jgi:CRP/FNR family transcriptional regulator